ncbi:hypothetical protein JSE7799_03546 [Jannaschia seosinensis]|uniref:Uncharacterized protein n=1 Tax=Jannaschia seosinensis TaxID=313367 RepID=A0A0M7BF46_9RHOB|nr:DUF892 family protein [Jannaschia seosinensis]CUH40809.1 hypothetical protein JSE7799_03546 [Jannaschia seosinensis]
MKINSFREMYLQELQEACSVESQLVDALPRMRDAAASETLKQALEGHLVDTRAQLARVETILKRHEVNPGEHQDQSMRRLIEESEKWSGMLDDPALRDAGLIASAQRIEHYEIAAYGTLACWAKQLGLDEDQSELLAILDQEKAADDLLTELAKQDVNPGAAQ